MNYLAHLHLADESPAAKVGNLLADFVKGQDVDRLPEDIQAGIRLHRAVDAYTDCHPIVMRSIRRLGGRLGWYAGIVMDVYYDHLLARSWTRYCSESLRDFADRMYRILSDHLELVTGESRVLLQRLIREDRLVRYRYPSGIAETLERLSSRISERMPRRPVRLQDALPLLRSLDPALEEDFHSFYPQLIAFVESRRAALVQPAVHTLVQSPL